MANEHNLWNKNSYEALSSLSNIWKKICFTTQLPKLYKHLYKNLTALDVCCCSRPCEGKKRSWRPREHFHIWSTSIPFPNAYKLLSRLKKPLPEVYAHSVGKFAQLRLLQLIKNVLDDDRLTAVPKSLLP